MLKDAACLLPMGTDAKVSVRGAIMKLDFLGTRGYIEAKTRRHRAMAKERGVRAEFAHDGMQVILR